MIKNEKVVFTGKLDSMSRKQAQLLVKALKGNLQASISKTTTLIVVGKKNINLFEEDSRSVKLKQVDELKRNGIEIRRISEMEFIQEVIDQLKILNSSLKH